MILLADQRPVAVLAIGNALDPVASRQLREFAPGRTVRSYALEFWPLLPPEFHIAVALDGREVDAAEAMDIVVQPAQSLVLAVVPGKGGGGGKNPFMTIAMVALTIYTGGGFMGSFLAGQAFNAGMVTMAGFQSFAMYAGVAATVVGGAVMSAVMGGGVGAADQGGGASDLTSSPTYSWDTKANPIREGGACAIMYGVHRVTPPCIGHYVSSREDGKQVLNLLYLVADHALDSIASVEINGSPSTYYSDVEIETRLGAVDQAVVSNFSDTISEKSGGAVLTTDWATVRTDGNAVEGLGVSLVCDQGLYYANNSGGLDSQTLTIEIEHQLVGGSGWTAWGAQTITDAVTTPVRRYYRKDNVDPGQYDVRVRLSTAPTTGARYRNRCVYESIQEIVYDDFRYPGVSLLSVKALATDQLSGGMPNVTCLATRSTVPVWTGSAYENLPANNPAWASWDLLHNDEYGGGIDHARIVYADFLAWAEWCAAEGHTVNLYVDEAVNFQKLAQTIATCGRGRTDQIGSKFTCTVDRPVDLAVQKFLFTVGNIVKDSFAEEFLPMEDRANSVEVTYIDADANYSRQVVEVRAADFDTTDTPVNKAQYTLLGCTSRAKALAFGQHLINSNRYLTNTVSFEADIDAIGCLPGDVVDVSHDVPQWGYSGRIVSATATQVVLDREVTLSPATGYALQVKLSDDTRSDVVVLGVDEETTTDTITIDGAWPGATPQADDLYSFGPTNRASKLFRIVSISRSQEQRRKVTALEYEAKVYTDGADIPAPETASLLPGVSSLVAVENFYIKGGVATSSVVLTWRGAALSWPVSYRRQGELAWAQLAVAQEPGYTWDGVETGAYEFRVQGGASSETAALTVYGKTLPPPALDGLYRQGDTVYWTYDSPPLDFAGFRVRVQAGLTRSWDKGADYPSAGALVLERSLDVVGLGSGVTTIMVRPEDTSGNLATEASFLTINLGELSPANLVATLDEKAAGFAGAIVGGSVDGSGNLVADDTGDAYLPDGSAAYLPQPAELYLPLNFAAMSYEWGYVPEFSDVPGILYAASSIAGEGWSLEYRRRGSGDVYLEHDDGAYLADGSALSLGGPTPWASIPGGGIFVGRERIDFRLSTDAGSRQGVVSALSVNVDVPDITESFSDIVVTSTGTRLPITKTYRAIDYIGAVTLQDDGQGATGILVKDKDPILGPLIAAIGASQATIDIHNMKGH